MTTSAMPQPGERAPLFQLKDAAEKTVSSGDFKGKWVVLYFYPKDDTSGCTIEAEEFTGHVKQFSKLNAVVVGVSPDSCASHRKFAEKHGLQVRLLSDPQHSALNAYGAWQKKRMYGREYMGVVRSTFIIDGEGIIRHAWPKVKARGHAQEVLEKLRQLCG